MRRYEIPCNDLDRALAAIDCAASSNLRPYSAGIHFKAREGMHIRGFLLQEHEWESIRGGTPLTTEFRGQFICKENRVVLEVLIYPALRQIWLIPLGFLMELYHMHPIGVGIWTALLIWWIRQENNLIQRTVAELKRITGAYWCDDVSEG